MFPAITAKELLCCEDISFTRPASLHILLFGSYLGLDMQVLIGRMNDMMSKYKDELKKYEVVEPLKYFI